MGGQAAGDDVQLRIESTRGPDDQPVCQITLGTDQWFAGVADVRKTALDMLACAAYAEMLMLLVTKLDLDGETASAVITDLLSSSGRERFGARNTLELAPAGSTKTGTPVVILMRGAERDAVHAHVARTIAGQWLGVAEATESDQLVSEALRSTGMDVAAQELVFGYLRALRSPD
jgi:hypothetical protein